MPVRPPAAPSAVPQRDRVARCTPIQAPWLDTGRTGDSARRTDGASAQAGSACATGRGRHGAAPASAAEAGFAVMVLVEAGLTGADPFARSRAASAYAPPAPPVRRNAQVA
jgi:hypothetical protein